MLSTRSRTNASTLTFSSFLLLASSLLPGILSQDSNNSDLDWVLFDRSQFNGNIQLDESGDVQLFWRTGDEYSTYGIASRSDGYLALGFSETGAMTGADMAVGYRDDSNNFVVENRHATGFVTPQLSSNQTDNIRMTEGDQRDGVTAFVFEKRNQASCLEEQVDVTTDSWQWFIYAHSDDNTFAQHAPGNNGKKYVKLGTGESVSVNEVRDIPNTEAFSIMQPEITIPTQETTYCYTLHKLPEGSKNFILGERPEASSDLLHHLVIYSCWGITDEQKEMVGQEPNCDYENFNNFCTGFVAEWAPGMSARTFEPGYGKPFGSDSYEYVMLETHYNNPDGLENEQDSSGYTLLYNDEQVDTEIGTLTLGAQQLNNWSLEPGRDIVPLTRVCTPECTSRWPEDGVTAVAVFFHMHQRGRNARVQIIRDGKEIEMLSSIRDFEYDFQYSKTLAATKLLPGDKFITTCEYDTSEDTEPVPGGLPSKYEMCFAWVDYYPANQVLICSEVDMGEDPTNPVNGTNALCVESTLDMSTAVYPSGNLTADFERLPESGNQCAASSTPDESPSGTNDNASPSSTGSAPSSLISSSWSLLSVTVFLVLGTFYVTL